MKKILEILKIPGLIVGCIVTIIGVYKYLESIPKRAEAINKATVEEVKSAVKVYSDSTNSHFQRIESTLNDHTDKLDGVIRSQATLKNLVTKEFAKTMTPQQVLDMMNEFELLKKNSYMNEIQLEPNNIWTPYSYKFEQEK